MWSGTVVPALVSVRYYPAIATATAATAATDDCSTHWVYNVSAGKGSMW
jgi:hypothetical protein